MFAGFSTSQAVQPLGWALSAVSRRVFLALLITLWVAALLSILALSLNYEFTPAHSPLAPAVWPQNSTLVRDSGPTLLVFLHPRCPCSRSTLSELEKVLTHLPHSGSAHCLVSPLQADENFARAALVEAARQVPRLQVQIDTQHLESQRFGARASGCVLLYDGQGRLQFSGGVTPSRGHAGANVGADAIIALLSGQPSTTEWAPTFGCSLPAASALQRKEISN